MLAGRVTGARETEYLLCEIKMKKAERRQIVKMRAREDALSDGKKKRYKKEKNREKTQERIDEGD